mgnify:CR=1 FL=1
MPCVETMRKEQDRQNNPIPLVAGAVVAGGAKKAGQTAYAVTEEVAPEVFEAGADMVYGITDKLKGLFKKNPAVGEKVVVDFGNGDVEVTIIRRGKVPGFWVVDANGQEITVPESAIYEKSKSGDSMKRYEDYEVPELEQNPKTEFKNEKEFMEYVYGADYDAKTDFVDLKRLSPRSQKMRKEFGTTWQEYRMMLKNRERKNPPKDINNNEDIIVPTMEQEREWAFTLANGKTRKAKFPLGFIPDDENCPKMNPDEGQLEITLITPTDGKCWNCSDAGCEVCQPKENPPVAKPVVSPEPVVQEVAEDENSIPPKSEEVKPNPQPKVAENPPKWNKRKITTEFVALLVSAKDVEKVKKYKSKFIDFWKSADEASKKYVRERLAKRPTQIQDIAKSWMSIKANPGDNMITEVVTTNGTGVETQMENVSEVLIVNPPEEAKSVEETPVTTPEVEGETVAEATGNEAPVEGEKVEAPEGEKVEETPEPAPEVPAEPKIENPPLPPQPVQMTCEHELKYLGKGNPKKGGKTVDVYKCLKCKKNFVWRD